MCCTVCNFGGVRYIIDLTIAWASAAGAVEWRHVGWDADQRAKAKRKSYEEAMERERQGQHATTTLLTGLTTIRDHR